LHGKNVLLIFVVKPPPQKNMIINSKKTFYTLLLFTGVCLYACNGNNSKEPGKTTGDSLKPAVKKEVAKLPETKYERPPIVNIVDTLTPKMTVIYAKDSAASFERIGQKLANIYGVMLATYINKNNLKTTGFPMAWYTKAKAPYFFEAGIPVNKTGAKAVAGVQTREIGAGKAVIAHFFGPFELLPQGYDAIKDWIKDNKKTVAGPSYEIYITDPIDKNGKPVDPYKVQTDIIFPIR
jgi:effector-binding domain-containing protein